MTWIDKKRKEIRDNFDDDLAFLDDLIDQKDKDLFNWAKSKKHRYYINNYYSILKDADLLDYYDDDVEIEDNAKYDLVLGQLALLYTLYCEVENEFKHELKGV